MMKRRTSTGPGIAIAILLFVGQSHLLAATMGTAFTYQGRFMDGGTPADAEYDFEFKVYDALTSGTQQGSAVYQGDVDVEDGHFTVTLDFGASVFDGGARWLQIGVRPGTSTGAYTTLTPRHELTPTPYASYAERTAGISVSNGNVGIGTTNPGTLLTVTNGDLSLNHGSITRLMLHHDPLSSLPPTGYASHILTTSGNSDFPFNDYGNVVIRGRSDMSTRGGFAVFTGTATNPSLAIRETSNVGIGTTSPSMRLHVDAGASNDAAMFESDGYGSLICLKDDYTTGNGYAMVRWGDFLDLRTQDEPRLNIDPSGSVSIGTRYPAATLDVNGDIRCVSLTQTSDAQLKTDVQALGGVLDKLDQIRGVSYRWNAKAQSLGAQASARRIGVLAQELEQVFPELVTTPKPVALEDVLKQYPEEMLTTKVRGQLEKDVERSHYKAVNYGELSAVLLEAVKELNTKAKGLEAENASLRQRMEALETQMQQLSEKLSN